MVWPFNVYAQEAFTTGLPWFTDIFIFDIYIKVTTRSAGQKYPNRELRAECIYARTVNLLKTRDL